MHIVNVAVRFLVSAFWSRLLLLTYPDPKATGSDHLPSGSTMLSSQLHTGAAGFIA